jgi:hypothetical protein
MQNTLFLRKDWQFEVANQDWLLNLLISIGYIFFLKTKLSIVYSLDSLKTIYYDILKALLNKYISLLST